MYRRWLTIQLVVPSPVEQASIRQDIDALQWDETAGLLVQVVVVFDQQAAQVGQTQQIERHIGPVGLVAVENDG